MIILNHWDLSQFNKIKIFLLYMAKTRRRRSRCRRKSRNRHRRMRGGDKSVEDQIEELINNNTTHRKHKTKLQALLIDPEFKNLSVYSKKRKLDDIINSGVSAFSFSDDD